MSEIPFNIVDIVFLIVLLLSGIFSFYKGIIQEILRIISWVGASFVALYGYDITAPYVGNYIDNELAVSLLTSSGLFTLTLVTFYFISRTISSAIKNNTIGTLNKSLGFLFGVGRGLVLLATIYIAMGTLMNGNLPETVQKAKTEPVIRVTANVLIVLLPEKFEHNLTNTMNNVDIQLKSYGDL